MPKIMLINVTHSEESRVAIINDSLLESFEIESFAREHLKSNLYKGVVHRIHPALEAAFVDIGGERDAFLPLDEICFLNLAKPLSGGLHGSGENGRQRRRIRDVLRPGEEILVQITKEPFANKPPTLTTFYSLPGRYLVLLPGSEDVGISRRIEGDERGRLRALVERLEVPPGFGLIVRTAAGVDDDSSELATDLAYLQRLWKNIQEAAASKQGPALVYREHDIVLRTIRDFFTPDIDEIHIDNEEVFQRAREFLQSVLPGKEHVLRLYEEDQPIFSAFDVESQIESIFKRRVQLRSGGSIVIDGTEALTAIDVNSGGSMRGANPEETAFRTNLEAASEVGRQLRLRDIGGLIVIDFIDMREGSHIQEIERTLRDAMKPDKARHEIGRISSFGLMEISRQRLRPAATATTYTACPMCEGHGAVRTTESAAMVALRKIHNRVAKGDVAEINIAVPPTVAMYLLNQKRDELARLEIHYNTRLQIDPDDKLVPHQIEISVRARSAHEAPANIVAHGSVAMADRPPTSRVQPASARSQGGRSPKQANSGRSQSATSSGRSSSATSSGRSSSTTSSGRSSSTTSSGRSSSTTSSGQSSSAASSGRPSSAASSGRPSSAASSGRPSSATSSEPPSGATSTSSQPPSGATSSERPLAATSSERPSAAASSEQPSSATSSGRSSAASSERSSTQSPSASADSPVGSAEAAPTKKRRRRRGRRKSPSLRAAIAIGEALAAIGSNAGLRLGKSETQSAPSAAATPDSPRQPATDATSAASSRPRRTGGSSRRGGRRTGAGSRSAPRETTPPTEPIPAKETTPAPISTPSSVATIAATSTASQVSGAESVSAATRVEAAPRPATKPAGRKRATKKTAAKAPEKTAPPVGAASGSSATDSAAKTKPRSSAKKAAPRRAATAPRAAAKAAKSPGSKKASTAIRKAPVAKKAAAKKGSPKPTATARKSSVRAKAGKPAVTNPVTKSSPGEEGDS